MAGPPAFAGTALSLAVTAVRAHLEEARQAEAETAERCGAYLKAAYEAVHGLEQEYDQIVEEARALDLEDDDKRTALLTRIDRFVRQEKLRPLLIMATNGLRVSHTALDRDANRFFRRLSPQARGRRIEAADRLSELLKKLLQYLDGLTPLLDEGYLRPDQPNPSAPELGRLLDLERSVREAGLLESRAARDGVRRQISGMLKDRQKGQFLYLAGEVGGTAEELMTAFR